MCGFQLSCFLLTKLNCSHRFIDSLNISLLSKSRKLSLSKERGTAESDTKDLEEFPVYSDTQRKSQMISGAKLQTCLPGSFLSTIDVSASSNVFEKQLFIREPWHSVVCGLFASLLRWIH